MSTEIRVPALGESVTEATVATWFKKPGDAVAVDEMLCELETDKVTVEVPASVAGTLGEIVAAEGETVGVNALLATISEGAAAAPAEKAAAKTKAPADAEAPKGNIDVPVPSLGESVTEATVASWFKKVGDTVQADEMIAELETDKVSVEVPAPQAGTIAKLLIAEGETVQAGGVIAQLSAEGAAVDAAAEAPKADAPTSGTESTTSMRDVENAPSANKMMAEKGLSADQVTGSGRDGRIMKEDVMKAASAPKAAAPAPTAPEPPIDYDTMSTRFVGMMKSGKIPDYTAVYRDLSVDYADLTTNQTSISRLWHYMGALDGGADHAQAVQNSLANAP